MKFKVDAELSGMLRSHIRLSHRIVMNLSSNIYYRFIYLIVQPIGNLPNKCFHPKLFLRSFPKMNIKCIILVVFIPFFLGHYSGDSHYICMQCIVSELGKQVALREKWRIKLMMFNPIVAIRIQCITHLKPHNATNTTVKQKFGNFVTTWHIALSKQNFLYLQPPLT